MTGICIKQLWPWWLLLPTCFGFWTKYTVDYDSMRVARCYSKCDRYPSINECMDSCLLSNYTKPGQCPEENSMSPFEAVCLIACTNDSQCTDLGKCCANDCGITCMHPIGLQNHKDLPPVPDGIEIRREKSNMVLLNWMSKDSRISDGDNGVWYVVEERHVLGPRYLESRLSSWDVLHMSSKPYASIKAGLKTGHWYQFRVAAVNENGSRGYSIPSKPFKTAEPRNPREPRNLSLSGARVQQADGKLRILLRWRQPPSDVPIMFYKLFWSQLIRGPTNESILIYHRSISKDKSCFEIKNLEIGCQYFLQVQAVSVYGGRRMASKKASKVFNSTDYSKYADVDGHAGRCERHHAGLRVRRLICHCNDEVDARLVWPTDTEAHSYNVSWRLESCSTFHNSKITPNLIAPSSLSHITQKTRFDIKNLEKNCTYSVNVRSVINHNNNNSNNNKKYNNELGQNDNNWQDINDERNLSIELTTNMNCNRIRQNRNNNNNNNNTNNNNNNNNNDLKMTKCKKEKQELRKFIINFCKLIIIYYYINNCIPDE